MRRGGKGTDKREMIELETTAMRRFANPRLVVVKMGPNSVLTLKAARPL